MQRDIWLKYKIESCRYDEIKCKANNKVYR